MATVWISLLAALTLAAQAPVASSQAPITVLVAPPDAAGAPTHVVEFAQEHVSEQLKSRGLEVIRVEDITRKMPPSKRRALLRCNRTEPACLKSLGAAGKAEVVLVPELGQFLSGYRAGARVYASTNGALITEHLVPGVGEDQLLDALTKSLEVVVPRTRTALRGAPPMPSMNDVPPPVAARPSTQKPQTTPAPMSAPEVTTAMEPAPRGYPLRRWAWLPAVGGVALAGVGTLFYLKAGDRYDALNKGGSTVAPITNSDEVVSAGRRAQTVSRVAYGLGAVGIATGVVMFLVPGDEEARVQPSAAVVPGGGMVGLSGTWP